MTAAPRLDRVAIRHVNRDARQRLVQSAEHMHRCPHCGSMVPRMQHRSTTKSIEELALEQIAERLDGVPESTWRWLRWLWETDLRHARSILRLTADLGVHNNTFHSRFRRAKLPSPKTYLHTARLTRIAARLEDPRVSVAMVGRQCGYTASQGFLCLIRNAMGINGAVFRKHYTGTNMLLKFMTELIDPHREMLLQFDPLSDARSIWSPSVGLDK